MTWWSSICPAGEIRTWPPISIRDWMPDNIGERDELKLGIS